MLKHRIPKLHIPFASTQDINPQDHQTSVTIMAATSTPRPHVLIIPGAWHPASTMASFADALEAAGFPATVVPTRSVGTRDITVQDDEAQAKALLQPLLDQGKDVIVLGHSYGGFVITGLIAGLDKRGREAQGLKGGILGVVYLAAFIPIEGETTFVAGGGNDAAFVSADNVSFVHPAGFILINGIC